MQDLLVENQNFQATFGQKWISTAGLSLTQNLYDQSVFVGLKAAKTTREFYQINEQPKNK
jgi:hypothetical protein